MTKESCVDLLIEKENEVGIVVEVKVGADEDGLQIAKYVEWLKNTRTGKHQYVFHLVKNHNPAFDITDHGGEKHHTWQKLYGHLLQAKKQGLEPTDASLIEHLCNYLEVEGIVSAWTSKEILPYGPGLVARRAIRNLFEQVEKRLDDLKSDYTTKIVIPDEGWPRLEIGRTSWKSIFGDKGYLTRFTHSMRYKMFGIPSQMNFVLKSIFGIGGVIGI